MIDLNALLARARALEAPKAEQDRLFWDAVRTYAKQGDLLCYGLYVHGEQHPALRDLALSPHAYIGAEMMTGHDRSLLVAHPESGKTALARWRVEQWIGIETERAFDDDAATVPSALYMMAKFQDQAEAQALEIRNTVERNRRYRELFPRARPDKKAKWEKGSWFLARPEGKTRPEPTVMASGIGGDIQGSRYGLAICDDPIDQVTAQSAHQVRQAVRFILGTLDSRILEGGSIAFRFTRWSDQDPFNALSRVCKTVIMPIFGFWEAHPEYAHLWRHHPLGPGIPETLWPGGWSPERAEAKKQQLIDAGEAALWPLVWLADPQLAQGGMIKRDWFTYGPSPLAREAVAV